MLLFIDTSEISLVTFALVDQTAKKKPILKTYKLGYGENWKTLSFLLAFLQASTCKLEAVTSLVVCSGPGSPTGLRVGVALAQGLSFGLKIPLQAIKKDKLPKNWQDLSKLKSGKNLAINYSRPAV